MPMVLLKYYSMYFVMLLMTIGCSVDTSAIFPPSQSSEGIGKAGNTNFDSGMLGDVDIPENTFGGECTSQELCDGIDNNCDGSIDEGCPCSDWEKRRCYRGSKETRRIGECHDGQQTCDANGLWGNCEGDRQPLVEQCNKLDDDCDGKTDEDNPGGGERCETGLPGICNQGTKNCIDGVLECIGDNKPGPELCDSLDNDCDPTTEDGSQETNFGEPCDGEDADLCKEGYWSCLDGRGLSCTDPNDENLDLCNGVNDDTTEDCNPETQDGVHEANYGEPCDGADADLCLEGKWVCQGAEGLSCTDPNDEDLDLCNGVNDDTTEDCNPETQDGVHEANYGEPCDGADADLCLEGVLQCTGGLPLICSDETDDSNICESDSEEDCNPQLDDECCSNTVLDGSVELGTPNPFWSETSSTDSSLICDEAVCGLGRGIGPRSGTYWIWLGGAFNDISEISQTLRIPKSGHTFRFYLALPSCDTFSRGYDALKLIIDDNEIFATDNYDPNCGSDTYIAKNVDISAWADGADHTIGFWSDNDARGVTNFMVDDIAIVCND